MLHNSHRRIALGTLLGETFALLNLLNVFLLLLEYTFNFFQKAH